MNPLFNQYFSRSFRLSICSAVKLQMIIALIITLSSCSSINRDRILKPVETDSQNSSIEDTEVFINSDVDNDNSSQIYSQFSINDANTLLPQVFENGDRLKVTIWGYPELDHTSDIQTSGTITLPLIGEIEAAGLTVKELRDSIKNHLLPFDESNQAQLRQGDSLTLRVWNHPELDGTSIIEPDGMVTLPLIGRIMAANRPIEDITTDASIGISEYIRDAQVTLIPNFVGRRSLQDYEVSVLTEQLTPREVAVIGEVNLQGIIPIAGSLRLVEALALSQVSQDTAALNSIVVIRNTMGNQPKYQQFRVGEFLRGEAPDQNIYLQNGDVVIVPKTTIAKVGLFVDQFFARIVPVFTFWSALHSASVAQEAADSVELINESLRRGLLQITPSL